MIKKRESLLMNRSGFTLVEVLISVAILAAVATGLLQIATNSKANFSYLMSKASFDRIASIPIMHNNLKYHHAEKNLYEFLRNDYAIKEDEIRKALKKIKVAYTQEEFTIFAPLSEDNVTQSENTKNLAHDTTISLRLIFDKITIFDKHNATYVYKLQKQ